MIPLIVLILIFIELTFSPRFDKTVNGEVLLWYYTFKNKRRYLKIIKL